MSVLILTLTMVDDSLIV